MVDLQGEDKGNISLPPRLQSRCDDDKLDNIPDRIINMQTAFYNMKINEILLRIERLEEQDQVLVKDREAIASLIATVKAKTGENIAQLTKELTSEIAKYTESKEKVESLEKGITNDKITHLKNVQTLNDRYMSKRLTLTSTLKTMNAKINVLDDFRTKQPILLQKLERTNQWMGEEEKKVKEIIERVHLKFKIDREKLKDDMYNRLLDLAGYFQLEISRCIKEPIHKLLRENTMTNNYLTQIMYESFPKKEICNNFKITKKRILDNIIKNSSHIKCNIKVTKLQNLLLKYLSKVYDDVSIRSSDLNSLDDFDYEKRQNKLKRGKEEVNKCETHVRQLEVILYREKKQIADIKYLQNKTHCKLSKCIQTLYDIKYAVACALQLTNTDPTITQMDHKQLCLHLLNIISQGETHMENIIISSLQSIPRPHIVYVGGDLGFEPEHIRLEKSDFNQGIPSDLLTATQITKPTDLFDQYKDTISSMKFEDKFRYLQYPEMEEEEEIELISSIDVTNN